MERYELIYVVTPTAEEKDLSAISAHVEKLITAKKGKILSRQDVGKRKIATPIKGQRYGYYFLWQFDCEPRPLKELEKELKVIEQIIRSMIIHYDEKTLRKMATAREKASYVTDIQKIEEKPVAEEPALPPVLPIQPTPAPAVAVPVEPAKPVAAEPLQEKTAVREAKQKQLSDIDDKLDKIIDDII